MKFLLLTLLAGTAYAAFYEDSADHFVDKINNGDYSFTAKRTSYFAGMSLEDVKGMMGTKMDGKSAHQLRLKTFEPNVEMAESFTSGVDKWSACHGSIFHIKDQGKCGSCWAVAASELVADKTCIANMASVSSPEFTVSTPKIDFSAAQIMECCYWCGQGCKGGYPNDAMRYWAWRGIVTGGPYGTQCGCMPYPIYPCGSSCQGQDDPTPSCNAQCISGYPKSFSDDKHYASDHYQISADANAIMQEIEQNGPVECAFTVYENFMHYDGGVYDQQEGNELGGHAVKIIGWGVDSQSGQPYWLINNSWNTEWGLSGQFKYLRGQDLGGMESQCVSGIAKSNDSDFQLSCVN